MGGGLSCDIGGRGKTKQGGKGARSEGTQKKMEKNQAKNHPLLRRSDQEKIKKTF